MQTGIVKLLNYRSAMRSVDILWLFRVVQGVKKSKDSRRI